MRKSNIELLRVILIFLLIGWHYATATYGICWFFLTIAFPAATVVPVFAIITGYFLIKDQRTFFALKFLITFIYVFLINLVVGSLVYGLTNGLNHKILLQLFKFGGRDWWYLWAILIIYLIAPIINKGLTFISRNYFIVMMVIFTILFFILAKNWFNFEYVQSGVPNASGVLLLLYYYLFGAGFRLYLTDFTNHYRKWIYLIAPLILLLFTVIIMILYFFNKGIWSLISPGNLPVLIASIAIFTLFHEIKIKDSKTINYFASLGLVIYLFHYLFQYLLVKYKLHWVNIVDVNFIINTLLTYCMTVVFSIPVTFIVKILVNSTWKGLNNLKQKIYQKQVFSKNKIDLENN